MDDESLVDGLRRHDKAAIRYIFDRFFPMIADLVRKNGNGSRRDAEDLFMDGLEVIYLKVVEPGFTLSSSMSTFLYEICRRQWLKKIKRKSLENRVTFTAEKELIVDKDIVSTMERAEQYQLFREKFNQLSKGCRQVLTLVFEGESMKEIAGRLGFASEQYARKRKYTCKEKLIGLIERDPRYHEMTDHD